MSADEPKGLRSLASEVQMANSPDWHANVDLDERGRNVLDQKAYSMPIDKIQSNKSPGKKHDF